MRQEAGLSIRRLARSFELPASRVGRWVGPQKPAVPVSSPGSDEWLLKILAMERQFVFGVYRRHTKAIGYLCEIDRLFGVRTTTRNWNTINTIGKVLGDG